MNNMLLRALSGTVYVALILLCIFAGQEWFRGLMTLFVLLGLVELQQLLRSKAPMTVSVRIFDITVAMIVVSAVRYMDTVSGFSDLSFWLYLGFILVVMYFPLRMVLAVIDHTPTPARSTLYSLLSQVYVTFPLCLLMFAYVLAGHVIVLATFVFIWVNDTGAYLCGITFGRHKLCQRLSPKKSWEGFFGGFIFAIAAGWFTAWFLDLTSPSMYVIWMLYAAFVSIFSTFGDLFESLLKRTIGVKDSGTLIPGHGGILDRIDSLLAVSPIAFIFAVIHYML